jgi:hypothetical protein
MSWTLTTVLKGGKTKRTRLVLLNRHGRNEALWWSRALDRMGMNPNVVKCWITPN